MGNRNKIYPESGVELTPFTARHYDSVMNVGSFGKYGGFIRKAIREMDIKPDDLILDLGCGTGRNEELISGYINGEGHITGIDISEDMEKQFHERFKNDSRIEFLNRRIDQPFDLGRKFDKVFISFVIHGFPHEVRDVVIKNAMIHLKPGGSFIILDFAEFDMEKMPWLHRLIFTKVECIYAFDFIKRDWKEILAAYGFNSITENFHLRNYVRLMKATKH